MKTRSALVLVVVGVSIILAGFFGCQRAPAPSPSTREVTTAPAPSGAVAITISSSVPSELNESGGGAPKATMQQAAAFAWQEFIALNWPAVNQTGGVVNNAYVAQRDVPDNNCKFGDPNCKDRPLVWETFRGKVEIFPGNLNGNPPPGYPMVAPGDVSLGYDALPAYNYTGSIPPCTQPSPSTSPTPVPSFINLDETDQITLNSMFAGAAPTPNQSPVNGDNGAPQMIRFLAKANRVEYTYIASQGLQAAWWQGLPGSVVNMTKTYLNNNNASPPAGTSDQGVSLPNGTIEIKAGWRVLNDSELKSGRFLTAVARSYENMLPLPTPPAAPNPCYNETTFGLVALHIIQKTKTAPYFIYATFEQADNIMTAGASPTPVEDVDGNIIKLPACPPGQTAPCPTTPSVTLQDTQVVSKSGIPPQVTRVPPTSPYCTPSTSTTPLGQLYYLNANNKPGLPSAGFICVNYRDNAIPQPVIDANQAAHAAMKNSGITDSPFLYYKLVNVQYVPIDKDYPGIYKGTDPNSAQNPANYHLANIVVETNRTLQLFSGSLAQTGSNSDYDSQFPEPSPFPPAAPSGSTQIHKNVFTGGSQYNMGGCMGCHGSQGQHQGGDFSVILANGQVVNPEVPAPVTRTGAGQVKRNRKLY
jgi:hypothetical protein